MIKTFSNTDCSDEALRACDGILARPMFEQKHLKSASADRRELFRRHWPDKDHFGIQLIAMSASERYGFNRNGDHWARADLQERHPTFVKHAGFYLEHDHTDPRKSRGPVKFSSYDPQMDRLELLLWGHKKKAEATFEAVKAGKPLAFSMAAAVPGDVCSICENVAPSPDDYCTHAANHLGQYLPAFQKFAYVRNPRPTFFDISEVGYPADRIAWWLAYAPNTDDKDDLVKVAATNKHPGSARLAQLLHTTPPAELRDDLGWSSVHGRSLLRKLAAAEARIEAARHGKGGELTDLIKHADGRVFHGVTQWSGRDAFTQATDDLLSRLRALPTDVTFGMLKEAGVILPMREFIAFATNRKVMEVESDPVYQTAHRKLAATMFRDQVESPVNRELEDLYQTGSHFKVACFCAPGDPIQELMEKVGKEFDNKPEKVRVRIMHIALRPRDLPVKLASASDEAHMQAARAMTRAYCHYKIAALLEHAHRDELVDSPLGSLIVCNH